MKLALYFRVCTWLKKLPCFITDICNPVIFFKGEIEVHCEESSESTSSREPFNIHQSNKDSKSGTSIQSQSEKAYSDDPPSFNTLEDR